MTMNISQPTPAQIEQMLEFIIRHNQEGETHIGYYGKGETEIRETLAEFTRPLEESFLLAWQGEELVSVFGVDYDPEIGRAWLYGPQVASPDWHAIADEHYAAIQELIPESIHEQELFFDANNQRGQEFAARHGFQVHSSDAVLFLERDGLTPVPTAPVQVCDYAETFFPAFETLHQAIFPRTYYTARQIAEKLDDKHRLLLAIEAGNVLGYHFCKRESQSGYIDFIGTDPSARGKGLGAALLQAGIAWMFEPNQIHRIELTVNANNQAAMRLYQKFGFATKHILCGYRKRMS